MRYYQILFKDFNLTVYFHAFQPNSFVCRADLQMELGEWIIQGEKKSVGGHIDVPEFSFGELDDLQVPLTVFKHFRVLKTWKGSYAVWNIPCPEELATVIHNNINI